MLAFRLAQPLLALTVAVVTIAASARAADAQELRCQEVLASAARAFAKRVHTVRAKCENRTIDGNACDIAGDAAKIAAATGTLTRTITERCTTSDLAARGFPGQCTDSDGPPFDASDAVECMIATHTQLIEDAIDLEYPGPPGPVNAEVSHCADHIGRSRQAIDRLLRARQQCRDKQNRGRLPMDVDCYDDTVTGTGDDTTDRALAKAGSRSAANLTEGCDHTAPEDLGFPGGCTDPDGGEFTLPNLIDCINETHDALAIEMAGIEYAAP